MLQMLKAAWALLACGSLLSPSLGAASQGGLLLRIRKKHLQDELAKRLTSFNLGERLTKLVEARKRPLTAGAGKSPPLRPRRVGNHPPPPPRITVETPHLPDAEITMRSSDSLDIQFRLLFGVYLEQSFDALSKEVEIQLRKNFSVLISRSNHGFSMKGCSSCPDSFDVKTLYKASNSLVDDASPMVQVTLRKDLIPVLDANWFGCAQKAGSGWSTPDNAEKRVDLSPPGILYSLKSAHIQRDHLVLELRDGWRIRPVNVMRTIHLESTVVQELIHSVGMMITPVHCSKVSGGEEPGTGVEEQNASLAETLLPSMHEEAAADIVITEKQMGWNFGPLFCPFEPIVVDKNHNLELEHLLVNVTIGGPARFDLDSSGALMNHPLNIEVSDIKEPPSNSTWPFTDVYSVPVDVSAEDHKLKISMSPSSAFLHMDEEKYEARDLVMVLEKVLDVEVPPTWLDPIRKELPLPMAPGTGDAVKMEVDVQEDFLLISVIPDLDASQNPAGE